MAVLCPEKCGKKFTTQEFAEIHADKEHPQWRNPKRRGWVTPYGFFDFVEPVTYEDALSMAKPIHEMLIKKLEHETKQPTEE